MQPVLTAAQMSQLDAYTIGRLGLDSRILMSNAARAVLDVLQAHWPQVRRVLVLSGTGNNGGDGLALALYGHQRGLHTHAAICAPEPFADNQLSGDCAYFYGICRNAFVPVELLHNPVMLPELITRSRPDVIVDALFGTGLSRTLGEFHTGLINRLNQTSRPILALDLPSGLSADTGVPLGASVEADVTATLGSLKRGLLHPAAINFTGEVEVAEIGLAGLSDAGLCAESVSAPELIWEPLRTSRRYDTHKGDYGKLLIVAGHARYPGAPRMCAEAALRIGAGLVRLVVPEPIYGVSCSSYAVMVDAHDHDDEGGFCAEPGRELREYLEWADCLIIGPGLGDGEEPRRLARTLIEQAEIPVVVDADALRAIGGLSGPRRWPLLLTPHAGELARMVDEGLESVRAQWFEAIGRFAKSQGVYLLAKANLSVLATPDGDMYFPRRGHPALARGGSGDILSGMLGALLARLHASAPDAAQRRIGLVEAAISAVNIHAHAAELLADQMGDNGVTPADLIDALPLALRSLGAAYNPCP